MTTDEFEKEILLNEAADPFDKTVSELVHLYSHLLKFKYQPYKQTPSWIRTIVNSRNDIEKCISKQKSIPKRLTNDVLASCYNEALDEVLNDCGKDKDFDFNRVPKQIPDELSINKILDKRYIDNYLNTYVSNPIAVDYLR